MLWANCPMFHAPHLTSGLVPPVQLVNIYGTSLRFQRLMSMTALSNRRGRYGQSGGRDPGLGRRAGGTSTPLEVRCEQTLKRRDGSCGAVAGRSGPVGHHGKRAHPLGRPARRACHKPAPFQPECSLVPGELRDLRDHLVGRPARRQEAAMPGARGDAGARAVRAQLPRGGLGGRPAELVGLQGRACSGRGRVVPRPSAGPDVAASRAESIPPGVG